VRVEISFKLVNLIRLKVLLWGVNGLGKSESVCMCFNRSNSAGIYVYTHILLSLHQIHTHEINLLSGCCLMKARRGFRVKLSQEVKMSNDYDLLVF
jgi:predicted AAA+ superfamily ATPase